jgi:tetratricopeptide (TPR) repeat protein
MPLGILLAATWVEMLSLQEIAQELVGDSNFLTAEIRDLAPRHRSVRAVFDYSWNLLSDEDRNVYAKLSIFQKGFSRDAAQVVTGATLRTLTALVNKSLVRRDPSGRYEIHEMLRQYAEERLNQDQALRAQVEAAHSKYYVTFMKACEPHIRSAKEFDLVPQIEQEFYNVQLAWNWALTRGTVDDVRHIIFSLDRFMGLRSLFKQKLDLFEQAVETLKTSERGRPGDKPSLKMGIILGFSSICYGDLGNGKRALETSDQALAILRQYDAPRELAFTLLRNWIVTTSAERVQLLEESLQIFRAIGESIWLGALLMNLAQVLSWMGEYERSVHYFEEVDAISSKVGDFQVISAQAYLLGNRAAEQKHFAEAEQWYREGLRVNQQMNSLQGMSDFLERLSRLAFLQGDFKEAESGYQEALAINRDLGVREGIAINITNLGAVAYAQGEYESAKTLFSEALTIFRELKRILICVCLNNLGRTLTALGDHAAACTIIQESLRLALDANIQGFIFDSLAAWADLLVYEDQPERAVEILSFTAHGSNSAMANRYFADYFADKQFATLRETLSPLVFQQAQHKGQTLILEELVQELLNGS